MKTLSVQFQPDMQPGIDFEVKASDLKELLRAALFVDQIDIDSGFKDSRYINVNIYTSDVPSAWNLVQSHLGLRPESRSPISHAVIVVCEGEKGWSDYLMLHHFDASEKTENIDSKKED